MKQNSSDDPFMRPALSRKYHNCKRKGQVKSNQVKSSQRKVFYFCSMDMLPLGGVKAVGRWRIAISILSVLSVVTVRGF